MDYTNEQIEEALRRLPEEFQEAIATSSISNRAIDIGKRYNLHFDQIEKLKNNVMLLALGFIDSSSFSGVIAKELSLTVPQAQAIVGDINREIFEEIRKIIKEKTTEVAPERENNVEPATKTEESLDREELLKAIESPEQIGSIEGGSIKYKELSIKKEEEPVLGIVEQKLGGAFKMENSQMVETDKSIASIKKIDPYREPTS